MLEEYAASAFERLKAIPHRFFLPVGLSLIGLMFLGYGLIQLATKQTPAPDTSIIPTETTTATQSAAIARHIMVDIEGAVEHPGVYSMANDSRLQDALVVAGGLSSDADRLLIAKQLNMAIKLADSAKVYIPYANDANSINANNANSVVSNNSHEVLSVSDNSNVININTASSKDLDSLPGIGTVTAGKIINGRPYGSIDELLSKKVVSQKVFDEIKDKVSL